MPRIELQSRVCGPTSFNYFRENDSKPYNFTKEKIPGFTQAALEVFARYLDKSVEYSHPRINANEAISKRGWTQFIPATFETGAKIGTCTAIVAAGYIGLCKAYPDSCSPDLVPQIYTQNSESFTGGLIAGTSCGALADLWSNVRRRWSEGKYALKELEHALLQQSLFIKENYKFLKQEMKHEIKDLKQVQASPTKGSPSRKKPVEDRRSEAIKAAFNELKAARDFDRALKDRTLEGSSSTSEEELPIPSPSKQTAPPKESAKHRKPETSREPRDSGVVVSSPKDSPGKRKPNGDLRHAHKSMIEELKTGLDKTKDKTSKKSASASEEELSLPSPSAQTGEKSKARKQAMSSSEEGLSHSASAQSDHSDTDNS